LRESHTVGAACDRKKSKKIRMIRKICAGLAQVIENDERLAGPADLT